MSVDRRIRFEYATCWQWNFWIRKEKVAGSKITGYAWTGRKTKFMTATATALTGTSLKSNTVAVHVRYNSRSISLPSSAKQQRKMAKFCVGPKTWGTTANSLFLFLRFKFVMVLTLRREENDFRASRDPVNIKSVLNRRCPRSRRPSFFPRSCLVLHHLWLYRASYWKNKRHRK